MYRNRSSHAYMCPQCHAALGIGVDDDLCFFICSYCRWDSIEIGLSEQQPNLLLVTALEREHPRENRVRRLIEFFDSPLEETPVVDSAFQQPWTWHDAELKSQYCESVMHEYQVWPELSLAFETRTDSVLQQVDTANISTLEQRLEWPMDPEWRVEYAIRCID